MTAIATRSAPSRPVTQRRGWPPQRRQAQAARIRAQRPWRYSTGPRTADGKRIASRNAVKTGNRSAILQRIRLLLRQQRRFMAALVLPTERRRAQKSQTRPNLFKQGINYNSFPDHSVRAALVRQDPQNIERMNNDKSTEQYRAE